MVIDLLSWLTGEKIPAGDVSPKFFSEGIGFGWGLTVFFVGAVLVWMTYRAYREMLSPGRRFVLSGLRLASLFVLVILLVQPAVLLEIQERVRSALVVLIDNSQSMQIADERSDPQDRDRAAVLVGADAAAANPKRSDLVKALVSARQDELWRKVAEKADIKVASFGEAYALAGEPAGDAPRAQLEQAVGALAFDQPRTALGDAVSEALSEWRGAPVAGIFVITDGAQNAGGDMQKAAKEAAAAEMPLFIYGPGVTAPNDLRIAEIVLPTVALAGEGVQARVKLRVSGVVAGTKTMASISLAGKPAGDREIEISGEPEQEILMDLKPEEPGIWDVEVKIAPVPGESETGNNVMTSKLRVVDDKVKLLYIEQKPRWDFRYIVDELKDDRRVELKAFVIEGPDVEDAPGQEVFLKEMPKGPELLKYQVVILGDVNPKSLGDEAMDNLKRLVDETGGGMIFLAGSHFNPEGYRGTPLEPLLPVDLGPAGGPASERFPEVQRLAVTPDGLTSPLLQLADDPKASEAAWADFKGVRWVARNTSAKPTATTLLVLPPSTPVVAQQTFGRGQTLYFGTDETYRWRSGVGGKFFARIWSQIIQNFALERMQGASATTQLRTDRAVYFVGDRVKIFGKVFDQEFRPLEDPRIEGELVRQGAEPGTPPDAFPLQAVAENPGLYQGEWLAGAPGVYQFTPLREREAKVNFEVKERNAELLNPALEAEALEGMAKASGGAFLREKELARLPELIDANASTILRQKTLGLYHVLPLLILFLLLLCTEWALRRLWQLK